MLTRIIKESRLLGCAMTEQYMCHQLHCAMIDDANHCEQNASYVVWACAMFLVSES